VKFYSEQDIRACFDISACFIKMELALKAYTSEYVDVPHKSILMRKEPHSAFISMPALCEQHQLYIQKSATFFQREPESVLPSIHAVVSAFSSKTGELLALMDGQSVTIAKCLAVSALVINYCAIKQAQVLAIIGAGVQAQQQFLACIEVRNITHVKVYARNQTRLVEFIKRLRKLTDKDIEFIICESVNDCIEYADIIATATSSATPLSDFSNVLPHTHINCMGSHTPDNREIPHEFLEKSRLIVEDRETAIAEAGTVHSKALELIDLVHQSKSQLQNTKTIFSSTGWAYLDVITVDFLLKELLV